MCHLITLNLAIFYELLYMVCQTMSISYRIEMKIEKLLISLEDPQ